jgi:hypothetical protein
MSVRPFGSPLIWCGMFFAGLPNRLKANAFAPPSTAEYAIAALMAGAD